MFALPPGIEKAMPIHGKIVKIVKFDLLRFA